MSVQDDDDAQHVVWPTAVMQQYTARWNLRAVRTNRQYAEGATHRPQVPTGCCCDPSVRDPGELARIG